MQFRVARRGSELRRKEGAGHARAAPLAAAGISTFLISFRVRYYPASYNARPHARMSKINVFPFETIFARNFLILEWGGRGRAGVRATTCAPPVIYALKRVPASLYALLFLSGISI